MKEAIQITAGKILIIESQPIDLLMIMSLYLSRMLWNIVSSSKIDENAVKDIGLPSAKWLGLRPRKLGFKSHRQRYFFACFRLSFNL